MAAAEGGTGADGRGARGPGEAAVLFAAGYDAEDIADMNPEERAAEAADALKQGVEPIDESEAARRMAEHVPVPILPPAGLAAGGRRRPRAPVPPQRLRFRPLTPVSFAGTPTPPAGATPVSSRPHAADEDTGDVVSLDPSKIKIDAARFQFKSGGDAQGGHRPARRRSSTATSGSRRLSGTK